MLMSSSSVNLLFGSELSSKGDHMAEQDIFKVYRTSAQRGAA